MRFNFTVINSLSMYVTVQIDFCFRVSIYRWLIDILTWLVISPPGYDAISALPGKLVPVDGAYQLHYRLPNHLYARSALHWTSVAVSGSAYAARSHWKMTGWIEAFGFTKTWFRERYQAHVVHLYLPMWSGESVLFPAENKKYNGCWKPFTGRELKTVVPTAHKSLLQIVSDNRALVSGDSPHGILPHDQSDNRRCAWAIGLIQCYLISKSKLTSHFVRFTLAHNWYCLRLAFASCLIWKSN